MSKGIKPIDINLDLLYVPKMELSKKQPGFYSSKPTHNRKTLFIQTHDVYFPFGISPPNPEKNIKKWSIPISEKTNGDITPLNAQLFNKHIELDEWLMNYAMANHKEFFDHPTVKSRDVYEEHLNLTVKSDKNPEKTEQYGRRIAPTIMTNEETGRFQELEVMTINPEWQPKYIPNPKTGKYIPNPEYDASIPEFLPADPLSIIPKSMGRVTYELKSTYCVNHKAFGFTWVARKIVVIRFGEDPAPDPDMNLYAEPMEFEDALANMEMPTGGKREREEEEVSNEPSTPKEPSTPADSKPDTATPSAPKRSKIEKIPKTKGKKNE
jgi:hypothetical protein